MTELEKAIAEWPFNRSNGQHALVDAAASPWAALVWRKGTERPEREGDYPVRCPSGLRVWTFFEGRWSDDGIGINDGVHFWWLSGPLPSLPEATDEG